MKDEFWSIVVAALLSASEVHAAAAVIRTAPPAPVSVAVVGRPPSARHIWVPGYYKGVNGRYVWVAGKWAVPPRAGVVWVPPLWKQGPKGYAFVPGHWR